ncbi:phosphatase PAP2 family protein [Pedococcus sp. KACC 23699]|uniref:Phosphatase PAP2 family protein n=1 Tax=Pedococcus sp. KACC 23699 TaxID=3149228 RepID=A0AAU7JX63_9MICO
MRPRPATTPAPQLRLRDGGSARLSRTPALAGAGVTAVALAGFAGLVDGVSEHADLASYDPGITSSVAGLRLPGLTFAAEVVSTVGSEVAIGLLTVGALAWLWFARRDRLRALLFGAAMAGAAALTLGVKHLLGRHRPPAAFVVGPVDNGYSFPSGHTLFSTVFLGLVVMLVVWPRGGRPARVATVAAWVIGSVAIGASRVYLGYHWTTDVIAGWVLAVAVLGMALVALVAVLPRLEASRPWRVLAGRANDDMEGATDAGPAR